MSSEPTIPRIPHSGQNRRKAHYNSKLDLPSGAKRDLLGRLRHKAYDMSAVDAATTYLTLSGHQFEELLERGERIFVIHTPDLDGTLSQFSRFARSSGKAIYLWQNEDGLKSLKVSEMGVPGSQRLQDALRYIINSPHYGVYGFVGFEREMDLTCTQYLKQVADARGGYDRKLFLISEQAKLPRMVSALAAQIVHEPSRRLRLRDGRWVV